MRRLHMQLEDWQQEALEEMAQARGVEVETLAQALLTERLVERLHRASDGPITDRPSLSASEEPSADTLERRLRRLFEE